MTTNRCRQNWSENCEKALNIQINKEYQASLNYHHLSSYFGRDDIGLDKLSDFYNKSSKEEREHADILMKYQNKRGGIVQLTGILKPEINLDLNRDVIHSLEVALKLEKDINESLINLHGIADREGDAQFADFLEGTFLAEQVEAISEISKMISQLERFASDKHGVWDFVNKMEA